MAEVNAGSAGMVAFFKARLAEDEAAAEPFERTTWTEEHPAIGVVLVDGEPLIEGYIRGLTTHIARHDPSRTLRDVEADRRLLARYERAVALPESMVGFIREQNNGYREGCLDAIRDRVAVWCGHPEYDQSWAPEPEP